MTIQAYAENLLNNHPVGPRESVSRAGVLTSFIGKDTEGRDACVIDAEYKYKGVPRLGNYEEIESGAKIWCLVAVSAPAIIVAVAAIVSFANMHFGVLPYFIALAGGLGAAVGLPAFAVAVVTRWHHKQYLNERLGQKELEAYLTTIKTRATEIKNNPHASQNMANRAGYICRALSEQELEEKAK